MMRVAGQTKDYILWCQPPLLDSKHVSNKHKSLERDIRTIDKPI